MTNGLDLDSYEEEKPHRFKLYCWRCVNALLFPITTHRVRKWLLRRFGARVGSFCAIYPTVRVYAPWKLFVEDYVCLGPHVNLYCKDEMHIGKQVIVSQDAYLCTASHDVSSPVMKLVTKPIRIENNAWVAAKAAILPGVTIGDGAVVGACAVVAKDVPPWSVAVGNPARVVGKRELKND